MFQVEGCTVAKNQVQRTACVNTYGTFYINGSSDCIPTCQSPCGLIGKLGKARAFLLLAVGIDILDTEIGYGDMIGVCSLTVFGNCNIKTVCIGESKAVGQKIRNLADRGQDTALVFSVGRVGSARKCDGALAGDQQGIGLSAVELRDARHSHRTAADTNTCVE